MAASIAASVTPSAAIAGATAYHGVMVRLLPLLVQTLSGKRAECAMTVLVCDPRATTMLLHC